MANIVGTQGNDAGAQALIGTNGNDQIDGLAGNDQLNGLGGADDLIGGTGDDLLNGGSGEDTLIGDDGNDTLISGEGSDFIRGGAGNDRIDVSGMTEGFGGFIQPGLGSNTIIGSRRLWDADEGHDLAYTGLSGVGGIAFLIGADGTGSARSGDGRVNDTFSFVHFFTGSQDSDSFISFDEEADTFRFQAFVGGPGNDTIDGGANGFDVAYYRSERFDNDNVGAVVVDLARGIARDTHGNTDTLINIEGVRGTALADRFVGSGAQEYAQFTGYAGADTIEGGVLSRDGDGNILGYDEADYRDDVRDGGSAGIIADLIAGTARDGFGDLDRLIRVDGIRGTASNDFVAGSDDNNRLRGFDGDDRLSGRGGDDQIEGGDGRDTILGGTGDDYILGGETANDLRDIVYGGAGDDTIDGGYGNDELRGDEGRDSIAGGFGADTVIGGAGDDTLTGSAFGDLISGGDGFDFINGGFGSDRLNGGREADVFFHLGIADHGSDFIQDFTAAEGDRLVWGGGAAGADRFQINYANTPSAGRADIAEAFVIDRATGQILWALIDGAAEAEIVVRTASGGFDLMV